MTTEAPESITVRDLVQAVKIEDIVFYEVGARRKESEPLGDGRGSDAGASGDSTSAEGPTSSPVHASGADTVATLMVRATSGRMEVRSRMEIDTPAATCRVDAGVSFSFDVDKSDPVVASDTVRQEFAQRVGFMVLYPYLREAAHQAVQKLRLEPPLLGIITADGLSFCDYPPGASEDSEEPPPAAE